jgi:hypothetical protein
MVHHLLTLPLKVGLHYRNRRMLGLMVQRMVRLVGHDKATMEYWSQHNTQIQKNMLRFICVLHGRSHSTEAKSQGTW